MYVLEVGILAVCELNIVYTFVTNLADGFINSFVVYF